MAICPDCNKQLSYSQMFRLNFKINKQCPYCGCRLYETKKSRNRQFITMYLPLSFSIIIINGFGIPFGLGLITFFIVGLLLLLMLPKIQRYSVEEEPWF